jgi:hypothetical protein
MKSRQNNESGAALIFTILILFILSVLGMALISVSMTNFKLTAHGKDYNTTYYLSDGAAEEVLTELDILTNNAEFHSLSEMDDYADSIDLSSYVTDIVDPEDGSITYDYNITGFQEALNLGFETKYIDKILNDDDDDDDQFFKSVVESVAFSPSFGNNFEETTASTVTLIDPNSLETNILSGSDILIDISGFYNNMERKIRLTIKIYVPTYEFKATGSGSSIYYYEAIRGTGPDYKLISWKEININ